jgi:Holliday junction resolvase
VSGWPERIRIGELHEVRMVHELEARGWTAQRCGQGTFPAAIRAALRHTETALRRFPDMIAANGPDLIAIDAKTRMPSTDSDRYSVSRDSLRAGHQFQGANPDISFYFIFGDLHVLTPAEVSTHSTHSTRQHTGSYYFVDTRHAHTFDGVFGRANAARSAT